ncbi:P-loop containing nucleoside triphosphate hydrolase protein [Hypoxylon sp. FL1150]|nr:P-loop containing nucleoside triphosphate hydrolase protein [Hypoxylon sp. FL1150]
MDFSGCLNDESFGPTVQGCRGDFDFTIMFEKIFFALIPSAVFVAICLPRIVYLIRNPALVDGAFFRYIKAAVTCIHAALQLALLVLSVARSHNLRIFFISSSALTFVSALCMVLVSCLEHSRSPRPSVLLNAYIFLTILFDIASIRTLWLASDNSDEVTFSRLSTAALSVKVLVLVLESQHKTRWIRWDAKDHSPEETTGLFGLGAFFWLNQLFLTGCRKILTLDDLFPLDQSMASKPLQDRLAENFNALRRPGQKYGLARALAKTLAVPLLLPVGPRIAMTAFQFCQPFLINSLLDYLQQSPGSSSRNIGYGLIGATILIYTGIATSGALYWYLQERAMYMIRGALAGSVYRKTIEAKITAADDSAALTLMSADVERIIRGCLNIHEFWANTVEVGLACWLLSRLIGAASAAPAIVVSCCVVLSTILGRYTGRWQKAWMEKIQKRVGLTASVIGQMKHIKISGLAAPVEESIQKLRVHELESGSQYRMVMCYSGVISYTPLCISPLMTFAFASRTLDVTTIFTSLSYILLLANPLAILFQIWPGLVAASTCLRRIQTFLEQDVRFDFRESALTSLVEDAIEDDSGSGYQKLTSTPLVKISEGSFGWQTDKPCLKDIDISIPSSRLTIVVGPIASGKSTLCKTLLGETPVAHGQVVAGPFSGKIGYCDQTPYLSNSTIRDNIVGFAPFDQARYNEVVDVTMLRPDLAVLPRGDETNVGSNGIALSGGQKQRVSIARALYLDSNFLVFDDVLSGLDASTEEQVFRKVFSPGGLLRRRNATVVLCTHSVKHLPSADHIIALGPEGNLVEQGSFSDLIQNESYVQSLGVRESDASPPGDDIQVESIDTAIARGETASAPDDKTTSKMQEQGRMMGDTAVYGHYFSRIGKLIIATIVFFGLSWGFCSNFATIWLKFWSEDVTSAHPIRTDSFYIGLYGLLEVMTLASLFLVSLVCFRTMISVSGAKLHKEALGTVINAPLSFFTTTDIGVVTNLFSQDMTLIDGELPQSFLNITIEIFTCLGMAAVIATSSPFLAITYPFLAVVVYGIQKFYLRTSRQIRFLDLEAKSPLYSHFIDTIKGVATFRAFGWVPDAVELNNRHLDTSQRPAYLLAMIQRWLGFTLQMVVAALAFVVVILATQQRSNTAFTGASLVTLMNFGDSLTIIVRMYTALETSIGAISRLKSFSETVKSESLEGEDIVPPPEWPLRGSIRIDGVSASYTDPDPLSSEEPASSDEKDNGNSRHLALRNLHLSIAPGEKVAICGRSGSGKSSTILLLLRLLDPVAPDSDKVIIDETALNKIDRATLRQRVIAVPQDPVFLPDGTTFQTNLDPFGTSTADECRAVLETVNLWDFIGERGGLGAGMSGDSLSGGQRQLFNLARAILRRRARSKQIGAEFGEGGSVASGGILLLDEVSSSVDQSTDKAMQNIIRDEFEGYTIVMVSHRLDMVLGFDTVVVMDKGSIVETGRPQLLLETNGSKFRELCMFANKGSR